MFVCCCESRGIIIILTHSYLSVFCAQSRTIFSNKNLQKPRHVSLVAPRRRLVYILKPALIVECNIEKFGLVE